MSGTARQVGKSQLEGEIHREIYWASGMHYQGLRCMHNLQLKKCVL